LRSRQPSRDVHRDGLEGFAQRAERELPAGGERPRERTAETRDHLTVQEAHFARLVRDGLSNPEIGARLFISPRTAEYHVHKVFNKLGITSRNELERALPPEPSAALASRSTRPEPSRPSRESRLIGVA
jgi:DNA-binding NarL/FixJ family response regulator